MTNSNTKFSESDIIITPPMKCAFVHLVNAKPMKGYTRLYYSVAAVFDNKKKQQYAESFGKASAAWKAIEGELGFVDEKGFNSIFKPFKNDEFPDHSMVNFKATAEQRDGTPMARPECYIRVDGDLKLIGAEKIGSGDYCRIAFSLLGQTVNNRITLKIRAVELISKGKPIRSDSALDDLQQAGSDANDYSQFLGEDAKNFDVNEVTAKPTSDAAGAMDQAAQQQPAQQQPAQQQPAQQQPAQQQPAQQQPAQQQPAQQQPAQQQAAIQPGEDYQNDDFFFSEDS